MDDSFPHTPPCAKIIDGPMEDKSPNLPHDEPDPASLPPHSLDGRVHTLARAVRRARLDNAEQSEALIDLRLAEITRLEIVQEALGDLFQQIPKECDIFDLAISPGEHPRLFIDYLGFIEMHHDKRVYCFLQDTRYGRIKICESDRVDPIVAAVTDYVAHRLVEREKALTIDYASGGYALLKARSSQVTDKKSEGAFWKIYLHLCELLSASCFLFLLIIIGQWFYRASGAN
ncbi:MAG: hypothetical protein ACKOEW_09950 [Methylocystis sp.]